MTRRCCLIPGLLLALSSVGVGADIAIPVPPTPLQDVQVRGDLCDRMQRAVKYLDQAPREQLWNGFQRKLGADDSVAMWGADWPGRTLEAYAMTSMALGHPSSARFAEVGYGLLANQSPEGSFLNGEPIAPDPAAFERKCTGFWFGNARGMMGLLGAQQYDGAREAAWLQAARKLGDFYVAHYFDADQRGTPGSFWWVGTEAMAQLYRETGERKYLDTGLRIAESIPPVNRGSQHTHSYLLALRGIVQLCELSGGNESLMRKVLDQYAFFESQVMWPGGGIVEHCGNREAHNLCYWYDEGCSVCDWLGLNLDLWRVTRDSRYMDMAERVACNHLLFDQDAGGGFCGDRGVDFVREGEPWPFCCAMHGTRTLAELTRYVGMTDGKQVWINLFYPATVALTVAGQRMVMDLETNYPADGNLTLTMREAGEREFPVKVRVPQWSRVLKVLVNDQATAPTIEAGYCVLTRRWAKGDRVLVELDVPLRSEARRRFIGDVADADYSRVSVWHGPRQLVFNQELNNHLWKLPPVQPALRYSYQTYGELQRDKSVQNTPLKIGKKEYRKGLGVHSVSEVVFCLGGQFSEFRSDIGVDSSAGGDGAVRFKVCVDGVVKCGDAVRASIGGDDKGMVETPYGFAVLAMTGKDESRSIRVNVQGAEEIRLVVDDAVNGQKNDFADWADAQLIKADGSVVHLSDLPDERNLGLPHDRVTVELAISKDETPRDGVVSLAGKLEGKSTAVNFSYLSNLGGELIRHRPVLASWLRLTPSE
jgi:DUF1680 family protein